MRFSLLLPWPFYRLRGLMVFWCGQYRARRLDVCRVCKTFQWISEAWVTFSVLVSLPYCCVLTDFDFSISVTWWRRVGLRAGFHNDGIDIYWGTREEWLEFSRARVPGEDQRGCTSSMSHEVTVSVRRTWRLGVILNFSNYVPGMTRILIF